MDDQEIVARRASGVLFQACYNKRFGKWGGWTCKRNGEDIGETIDEVNYNYDSPGEVLDELESNLGNVRYWREKFGIE